MCSLTQPHSIISPTRAWWSCLNQPSTPHSSSLPLNLLLWHVNDILYLCSTFVQSMEDSSRMLSSAPACGYLHVGESGAAMLSNVAQEVHCLTLTSIKHIVRHGDVTYDVCIRQCSPRSPFHRTPRSLLSTIWIFIEYWYIFRLLKTIANIFNLGSSISFCNLY